MDQTNLDVYGAEPIHWPRAHQQLKAAAARTTYWLATTRHGGRPHIAGVGVLWSIAGCWASVGELLVRSTPRSTVTS